MAKNVSLKLFEQEKSKKTDLIKELKEGEKSRFAENFDAVYFLQNLHKKYLRDHK